MQAADRARRVASPAVVDAPGKAPNRGIGLLFATGSILVAPSWFCPIASDASAKTCTWAGTWHGRGQADENQSQTVGRIYPEGYKSVA